VRLTLRRSMVLCAAALVAGCESSRLGGPLGSAGGTGTTGSPSGSELVGTWRRILFFIAEDGSSGSNETTWRFNANRTASRITVTRNFTAGISDAQVVEALWEPMTQSVRITFLPPSSGTFEFSYRITADTLFLASQGYGRVGP
jgi:hypothetical protein